MEVAYSNHDYGSRRRSDARIKAGLSRAGMEIKPDEPHISDLKGRKRSMAN
jgi:hypothetical protein